MNNETVYDAIKRTVQSYLPDSRVLLFGSHARGDYDKHSDYDLLVITPNLFTDREKINWSSSIHKAIVKAIHAPVDVLLYSETEVIEKQKLPGHIVGSAMKEGMVL